MTEKEKPKRSTRLGFTRSCLAFALYPLLIFKLMAMGLVYWAIGGYVKPSLDPQYIPTAEYLLENFALEAPHFLQVATGPLDSTALLNDRICFNILHWDEKVFSDLVWSELYINEQIVTRLYLGQISVSPFMSLPGQLRMCYDGHLDSGLHLIEFRAKENLFAEPYYIQRWAIEIP